MGYHALNLRVKGSNVFLGPGEGSSADSVAGQQF